MKRFVFAVLDAPLASRVPSKLTHALHAKDGALPLDVDSFVALSELPVTFPVTLPERFPPNPVVPLIVAGMALNDCPS
jgi:hypothetical protein